MPNNISESCLKNGKITRPVLAPKSYEKRFRVSVRLEHYFSDERSRVFVSAVPWRPVSWLEERLRTLFGLRGRFYLCSRGHLLPPPEPLSLLHLDDPVEVIPIPEEPSQDEMEECCLSPTRSEVVAPVDSGAVVPDCEKDSRPVPLNSIDANLELERSKQQALTLLDQCGRGSTTLVDCEPRRVRRRVRRRRPRAAADGSRVYPEPLHVGCDTDDAGRDSRHESDGGGAAHATGAAAVLRNVAESARAARVVRPLSPAALA